MMPKKIVAIIPARGGSKGILRKNVRVLAGKPLIAHTILDAKESTQVSEVYVSTDDAEIARISRKYGAKVIARPLAIAGDSASSEAALLHALQEIEGSGVFPDLVVFLQCTSPIRTGQDIDKAVSDMVRSRADSLLSVVPTHQFLWEKSGGKLRSISFDYLHRRPRQDMPPQYIENGSIYVFKPGILKKYKNRLGGRVAVSEMGEWSAVDIDTLKDFKMCEWIVRNILKKSEF